MNFILFFLKFILFFENVNVRLVDNRKYKFLVKIEVNILFLILYKMIVYFLI